MNIRPATPGDAEAIWRIIGPVIAAGETYALPPAYWFGAPHAVFVAEAEGEIVGAYYTNGPID